MKLVKASRELDSLQLIVVILLVSLVLIPALLSADETTDVGSETGSVVTDDYAAETSKFNGAINWVQLDQGADDADHLITPEERLRVAMARQ